MKIRTTHIVIAFILLSACGGNTDSVTEADIPLSESPTTSPVPPATDNQEQYLIDNSAREEVVITDSGLQYEILRSSEGSMPTQASIVTVHYVGSLTDGTEFDNSYIRGEPETFPVNGALLGFAEGLTLMNVGSQFRFVMPPSLGHGDSGVSGSPIVPGSVLIFVVELLEINSI